MSTSTVSNPLSRPRAKSAEISRGRLHVCLTDGREISAPLKWFEWLANSSHEDRYDFQLIEDGAGIWWDRLDEGISVPVLMGVPEWQPRPRLSRYVVEYRREGQRWIAEMPEFDSSTWARSLPAAKREARGVMAMLLGVDDVEAAGIDVVDEVHTTAAEDG